MSNFVNQPYLTENPQKLYFLFRSEPRWRTVFLKKVSSRFMSSNFLRVSDVFLRRIRAAKQTSRRKMCPFGFDVFDKTKKVRAPARTGAGGGSAATGGTETRCYALLNPASEPWAKDGEWASALTNNRHSSAYSLDTSYFFFHA
jgi:hypothetical protein